MGRRRESNLHLPPHLYLKDGSYRYKRRVNGKQVAKNFGKSLSEALRLWAEAEGTDWEAETVRDAILAYLDSERGRLAPQTIERYEKSLKRLSPVFGDMRLADLEPKHVYQYLKARGDVSANRDRALLSAAYTHARRTGLFRGDDPTKALQYRNPERPRTRLVTDAELAALIAAAPPHMARIIEWAAITGMRQGDILALKVSDAGPDGVVYRASKTGKELLLRWTPSTRRIWQEATQGRIGQAVAFRTTLHTEFTGSGFRASWRAVCERAGVQGVTFHDLRAKAATDAKDPSKLLQHSDPKVTQKHYLRGRSEADPTK